MSKKQSNYWNNYNNCKEEALKYNNKTDFHKLSKGAYESSRKNGWLNDICSHMYYNRKPNGYWNDYNKCKEEALKYRMKSEFKLKNYTAYNYSLKNNWLNEICNHMVNKNPKNIERIFLVYVYEFVDNHAYVGITSNLKRRKNAHNTNENSPIFKHKKLINNNPQFKILENNISVDNISKLEEFYMNKYLKNKWNLLNIAKAGSIGSNKIKWTKEKCTEVALLCDTRVEFQKKYPSAKNAANRYGWYDEITKHMEYINKPSNYWNKSKCQDIALNYISRSEFQRERKDAYLYAYKNNILDEVCSHIPKKYGN